MLNLLLEIHLAGSQVVATHLQDGGFQFRGLLNDTENVLVLLLLFSIINFAHFKKCAGICALFTNSAIKIPGERNNVKNNSKTLRLKGEH